MVRFCLLLLMLWPQQAEKPLPDPATFMVEFRKTLHSDDVLLSHYTYNEKDTEITLDSKGNTKKTEFDVFEVIHSDEDWKTYRRQIVKKGVPLTEKELAKQDREEKERVDKEIQKRERKSEAKRAQDKAKEDREEQELLDDIFAMYDLKFVRREVVRGTTTILVEFSPRPKYKTKTSDAKMLQHISGRAWIAEDDHELVRLEAEIIDPISIGAGLLAKVNKGSTLAFDRSKINGEIWLPVKAEATLNAKVLLLKGFNLREVAEFSEHKKFGADIQLEFGEVTAGTNDK